VSEDNILEVFLRMLQDKQSQRKKDKKKERTAIGLESKLASPSAPELTGRERVMLKDRLAASSLEAEIGGNREQ